MVRKGGEAWGGRGGGWGGGGSKEIRDCSACLVTDRLSKNAGF